MNKTTKSFAILSAAAAFAAGGIALAQSPGQADVNANPKTSTPGAGCTATGNAMSGGNLGGSATNKDCAAAPTRNAAAPAAVAPAAAPAAAAPSNESTASTAPATSSSMAAAPAPSDTSANQAPARVARADRG